jgi:hypothetical protein
MPYFGFNAKGIMNPAQQTQFANSFLDRISSPAIKQDLVIRVTGGTSSQTTYDNDWTPDVIQAWANLQKRQGVRMVYVVNGNDSPANQADAIKRWMAAGARFDFLEMMNEYYLPKFARGDLSKAEVKEQVTPEKYVNTILPAFWAQLDQFHLPYYLILAPDKSGMGGGGENLTQWNDVVLNAIRTKYPDRDLNVTLHLYSRSADLSGFNYGQIDQVRAQLPAGRHIAVTEAGILDPSLSYAQAGSLAVQHYRNIMQHLRKGDYLLDQVLYNKNKRSNIATLSPQTGGLTPKGQAVLDYIQGGLK